MNLPTGEVIRQKLSDLRARAGDIVQSFRSSFQRVFDDALVTFTTLTDRYLHSAHSKKMIYGAAAGGFVIAFIAINVFAYNLGRATFGNPFQFWTMRLQQLFHRQVVQKTPQPTPTPSPTPTPRPLRGSGKIHFSVSGGSKNTPTISEGWLDPIDPKRGEKQVLTIVISSENAPVTSVVATFKSDNEIRHFPLQITTGTTTNGTWQGEWMINDSYAYRYRLDVEATSDSGVGKAAVMARDNKWW